MIPRDDTTLLFANAGMNQFKNYFLGLEKPGYSRAVTSQKCVRAGGKHNDLENVGFTARHHTFFEMLGNFSFGDYFKEEAILMAWELLTQGFGLPKERLYVTVFDSDDEAADIWHQQAGVPQNHIFRFTDDNFWRMGDVGPCGPCSEIFYDHGPHAGKESDPFQSISSGKDRFIEIWNLVFMQFYEKSPGVMDPLPNPSVDTGAGLERLAAVLQEKLSNFDTDLFWPLIERSAEISKRLELLPVIEQINKQGIYSNTSPKDREFIAALRVVADHTRSCTFLMADGVVPSNEGRGYVLRRIFRRAVRFANLLAKGHSFLPELSKILIEQMGSVYPELTQRESQILTTFQEEQDRFMATLGAGESLLVEELNKSKLQNKKELPGAVVFKLYDTFGFPVDLTRLMAAESGFTINEKEFEQEADLAKEKSKATWKGKTMTASETHVISLVQEAQIRRKSGTSFVGYDSLSCSGHILALSNKQGKVYSLSAGETGLLISDQTPFYGEGGGQTGDSGYIYQNSCKVLVQRVTRQSNAFIHHIQVEFGVLHENSEIEMNVNSPERSATARNHSATHLLHSALRKILGDHVAQSGSFVDHQKLRFDFTHNKSLSFEELQKVEDLVNAQISLSIPVQAQVLPYKEALNKGALALFGEKYGDHVRMLKMGDFSTELCGGTHVNNTSEIRVFKIVSETGVSAGIRRLEAITGDLAVQYLIKSTTENQKALVATGFNEAWSVFLNNPNNNLLTWIEEKKNEIKALEKEIKKLQGNQIDFNDILSVGKDFRTKEGKLARFIFADLDISDREILSQTTDSIASKAQRDNQIGVIVVVIGHSDNAHPIIVSVSKSLNPEISAASLLKEIAQIMGGRGGGRPDFAQGAAPNRQLLNEARKKIETLLNIN